MTVNFKRIGLKDDTLAQFQQNVEQMVHELNDTLDEATTTKLYGKFTSDFTNGLTFQDATGFSIAYDNTNDALFTLTLDANYSKFLFCSFSFGNEIFFGEPMVIRYLSDTLSSGGKVIELQAQGDNGPQKLDSSENNFIELTLKN